MAKEGLNYYTKDEVDDLISGGGGATTVFMKTSVYDTNNNGIVDNAEKVNGKTVQSNVPANAKFTDTTYTAGTGIAINNGVISCTYAPLPQGTKFNGSTGDLYNFLLTLDLSATATQTDFSYMFNSCHALTRVPLFNTSAATTMNSMFNSCYALTSVPQFNTSNVTNMSNAFERCRTITTMPLLDMSKVTNCAYIFDDCTSLVSVPQFDMGNCTDPGAMFNGCSALVTVPQFNWSKVTSFGGSLNSTKMFYGCTSLSNASLNNILASLAGATSFSGGLLTPKTLKFIGLTQAQATICEGLSNFAAFTAAGWSTGY